MIRTGLITLSVAALFLSLPVVSDAQTASTSTNTITPGGAKPKKLRILGNVDYDTSSRSFDETSTFDAFLERGTTRRSYEGTGGVGFELGVIYNFTRVLGVLASFELHNFEHDGTLEVTSPHPLYFNQQRSATEELTGLSYSERAFNVDIVYTAEASPKFVIDLFGGATFFFTETELIDEAATQSAYPFDDLTLANTRTVQVTDNPIGFNAGAALTYKLTPVVGVAFQARFSQGGLEVSRAGGDPIDLDAGGFRIGGGIRLTF